MNTIHPPSVSTASVALPAVHPVHEVLHPEEAEAFLAGHRIAVIGASDERGNMGDTVMRALWLHGHQVVPVHATARLAGGHRCYPTVGQIPGSIDGAMIVVNAEAAVDVVRQCIDAGIRSIWLFQGLGSAGAVSDEAVALCRDAGVAVVAGACPLMFLEPVGGIHRLHRAIRRARGTLTRPVP